MCGIVGFNWNDRSLIKKMSSVIEHRGPNQEGFHVDRIMSLGHKRLSIIDLSAKAKQPIYNEKATICVVFNGEIYNFKEIREELKRKGHKFRSDSDSEVIVHSYEEYGEKCLDYFNGCFAFAIYDMPGKKLFLARDRLGERPLYFYKKEDKFIFASEIKAILEYDELEREVNLDSLNDFITLRYIPGQETIFKNIYRLLAGQCMTYNLKNHSALLRKYWDVNRNDSEIIKESEEFFVDKVKALFEDSVKKRLISDVPLGVYLSGGIDSSAIVAMMRKLNPKGKIKTFSVGFEDDPMNELSYAKQVSKLFRTEHTEFMIKPDIIKILPEIIWHLDEPLSDPACVPSYVLSEKAKKSVTVILTGDGGDDLFAGYDQFKFPVTANKMKFIPPSLMSFMMRNTPSFILNRLYKYSSETGNKIFDRFDKFIRNIRRNKAKAYLEIISTFDEDERNELFKPEIKEKIKDFSHYSELNDKYFKNNSNFLNQILYMELKRYLPEDLLMKPDKTCSAWAVESRAPFLDHRLAELAFKMPPELKLKGFTTKYILKKSLEGVLPKNIIYRRKQPFQVPLGRWIEKDLKPLFEKMLSEENIKEQGYFNYEYIKKIFDDYKNSKLFYGRQLWSLLNFCIWHKIYIERKKVSSIL